MAARRPPPPPPRPSSSNKRRGRPIPLLWRRPLLLLLTTAWLGCCQGRVHQQQLAVEEEPLYLRRGEGTPYQVLAVGETVPQGPDARSATKGSWIWQRRKRAFDSPAARACAVFCEGELLDAVQTAGIFEDSKEFVDMPMRVDPEVILDKFAALPPEARHDRQALTEFINAHFWPPGSELVALAPQDFTETPSVLARLTPNSSYYSWAQSLNVAFQQLTRKVSGDVFEHPQRYSILRRMHPIVIPGGRFRESYYWDSYWIVLGLLACDMKDTARGLVQNLLDDVANFGFVPNGGRIYYLNRSQPPLLSEMVLALLEADEALQKDAAFVASTLALLDAEYAFWMKDGEHAVQVGEAHVLNRYWTAASYPRPESYKEDKKSNVGAPLTAELYGGVYANIAAGAESGWDFSSRWMVPGQNGTYRLADIETTNILPVELNAFLYRMERNLARLHEFHATGTLRPLTFVAAADVPLTAPRAVNYSRAADRRALAMDELLWDPDAGMWKDYVVRQPLARRNAPGVGVVSVSNFIPLWSGVVANPVVKDGHVKAAQAVQAFKQSGLVQVGGVQTTTKHTEEQWDTPNAWPPLQQLVIEGLERTTLPEATQLARALTKAWLQSNYLGFVNTGSMHEKYNALVPGARGEGGEYYPQVGFGWTNGVVLHLLNTYGDKWTLEEGAPVSAVAAADAAPTKPMPASVNIELHQGSASPGSSP